ncbi:flagellin N-terminal helical domain-containing protein [Roseicitreum antarcticum]|uniref:Flagellin n=1 Tax=Roseicitreum antarcticum TaxID=564137 RepID=A0A1H2XBX1_9RHOB|nr:flagellin [Roseicitreum antarcticum]SDW89964.1 flagellin [Roseicitreum antarcticum]
MSSILTNTGSMVALQTLRGINSNLAKTQSDIATGKSVANAKDNAAIWAISKTMESDVKGFQAISGSLQLGQSTVSVARQAAESISDLLVKMKGRIVAGQEENIDADTIQKDVVALRGQIETIVGAAQFSGLNLIDNDANVNILSSLNRAPGGAVTSSSITVAGQDLSVGGYTAKAAFTGSTGASTTADVATFSLAAAGTADLIIADPTYAAGDSISVRIGEQAVSYKVTAADVAATSTAAIIAVNLKSAIDELGITGLTIGYDDSASGTLSFSQVGGTDRAVTAQFVNNGAGGLGALAGVNVASDPAGALGVIDGLIKTATDAAASFGSVQGRIDTQAEFVKGLTDALTAGIGSLVDADMEETSARLQALQVQQQLGIQALSIANQQPQNVLSLFR